MLKQLSEFFNICRTIHSENITGKKTEIIHFFSPKIGFIKLSHFRYADEGSSEKKVVRSAFRDGDAYFRSGIPFSPRNEVKIGCFH